jgi:CBS domain-containing protein
MRIADLLASEAHGHKQPPPLTCGQTVENAARRMERFGLRALAICRRDGSVAGVIEERDIVVKVVARARASELCTVDEIMSNRFVTCQADDPVEWVARLFEVTGFACAVVRTGSGELAGVLSAAALAGPGRTQPAGDLGRERVAAGAGRERTAVHVGADAGSGLLGVSQADPV